VKASYLIGYIAKTEEGWISKEDSGLYRKLPRNSTVFSTEEALRKYVERYNKNYEVVEVHAVFAER
jgi:hypothetical protein